MLLPVLMLFVGVLSAVSGDRILSDGEKEVFNDLWGVCDMRSLIALEDNPKEFWIKRKKELFEGPGKLLTHLEFCQKYTQVAKDYINKTLMYDDESPWFKGANAIEGILKDYIPEGTPQFAYALFTCYVAACDQIHIQAPRVGAPYVEHIGANDLRRIACLDTPATFCDFLQEQAKGNFRMLVAPCSDNVRWLRSPSGKFSFIDSLIVHSEGYFLCAAPEDTEEWSRFVAHDGVFQFWLGILSHDVFTHAMCVFRRSKQLASYGISLQENFKSYCNPEAFVVGNLVVISKQVQAWFHNDHELVSCTFSTSLVDLLFPDGRELLDAGFKQITTYFAHISPAYNWREDPLERKSLSGAEIQAVLSGWRNLYCAPSVRFLRQEDMGHYINRLQYRLSDMQRWDINNAPHFVRENLEIFRTVEGAHHQTLEDFSEDVKAQLMRCARVVQRWLNKDAQELVIYAPYSVIFLGMFLDDFVCLPYMQRELTFCLVPKNQRPCVRAKATGSPLYF